MAFQIDKNKVVEKFREHLKKHADDKQEKFDAPNAKKVNPIDKYEVLLKIKKLYEWVLDNQKLTMRRSFIHNDEIFNKYYNLLQSHINNKIRAKAEGMYIKVNDKYTFTGDIKEYEDYIVNNKHKLVNVIRGIVDELNKVLTGDDVKDDHKVMLRDILQKEYQEWCKANYEKVSLEEIATALLEHIDISLLTSIHDPAVLMEFTIACKKEWVRLAEEHDDPLMREALTFANSEMDNVVETMATNMAATSAVENLDNELI